MNWCARHRQEWIAETLRVFLYINREHLMRKFSISEARASADMRRYARDNPTTVRYDMSAKRYVQLERPQGVEP